jgi:hypothetical protein
MGLFDLVFDELSKEIKEAPGWLSLVFACNLVLLVPVVSEKLALLDISREGTTIATLVAFVLFFLGDLLDSIFFPRERDGTRFERILKSLMLLLGAFAVFFFLLGVWLWAVGLTVLWILIILWTQTGIPRKKVAETNESDNEMTGLKGLVVQYDRMTKSKDEVGKELHIRRGMYRVSMALARKADSYTMSIWFPNEAAKFIRSVVFPSLAAGVWLLTRGRNYGAALLILASPGLLILSCSLKGLHIRRVYDLALEIIKTNATYSSFEPRCGVRLFLFGDDVVDHASGSSLAKR